MRARLVLAVFAALPLVAQGQTPNPTNLWVVDLTWKNNKLSLGTPKKITKDNGASQPSFSPDGTSIIFSALRDTGSNAQSDIYRIDLATGVESRVTHTPENENSPTLNARGEYVAVRWRPATLFKEFGPWVYSSSGEPTRGVLRGPDSTGYYVALPNGNYALTRPKSKSFTLGLFDAASGVITDVDSGVPALPAQRIPGANALSYVQLDSANAKHTLRRVDLGTRRTSSLGPTLVGRTVHSWIPGHQTVLMAKGNELFARTLQDHVWRLVATFDNPELRNVSAYAVSAQGDKLVLVAPLRLSLAVIMRDSLEAGQSGAAVTAMATSMRASGALATLDVTEGSLIALGNDRLTNKHIADAVAVQTFVTTQFPQPFRAFEMLGDAQNANGDRTGAVASWRKALEVNPKSTEAERTAAASVERKIAGKG